MICEKNNNRSLAENLVWNEVEIFLRLCDFQQKKNIILSFIIDIPSPDSSGYPGTWVGEPEGEGVG